MGKSIFLSFALVLGIGFVLGVLTGWICAMDTAYYQLRRRDRRTK